MATRPETPAIRRCACCLPGALTLASAPLPTICSQAPMCPIQRPDVSVERDPYRRGRRYFVLIVLSLGEPELVTNDLMSDQ